MYKIITHETDRLAGADSDFVGLCVRQTWVLLVGKTILVPAPTPILSVRVRPPLVYLFPVAGVGGRHSVSSSREAQRSRS